MTITTQTPFIPRWEDAEELVRKGITNLIAIDTEGGGLDHMDRENWVRGCPQVLEIGYARSDLFGNFMGSGSIPLRALRHIAVEAAAPLVQQVAGGVRDYYESPDRLPYMEGIADFLDILERAPYEASPGEAPAKTAHIEYFSTRHNTSNRREEKVIPLYFRSEKTGQIIECARRHPDSGLISVRFQNTDADAPFYEGRHTHFYVDKTDNDSLWFVRKPSLLVLIYNGKGYDLPVLRVALARAGVHPSNLGLLYSRATIEDKQRQRFYFADSRNIARACEVWGWQGEDGIVPGRRISADTGLPFRSEALAAYLGNNDRAENLVRLLREGPRQPGDGSRHDPNRDHSARIDAEWDLALFLMNWQRSPKIAAEMLRQSNEDYLRKEISSQDVSGTKPKIFALPRREFPYGTDDRAYLSLGTDDTDGRFRKILFLLLDGHLANREIINGRTAIDMTVEDWANYWARESGPGRDPDRIVRAEQMRGFIGMLSVYDQLLLGSASGKKFRKLLDKIQDSDLQLLMEHPHVIHRAHAGLAIHQGKQRRKQKAFRPIMEEEWPYQGFGETYYDDPIDKKAYELKTLQQMFLRRGEAGAREVSSLEDKLNLMLETVKMRRDDDYKWMNDLTFHMIRLFVTTDKIDFEKNDNDARVLNRFNGIYRDVRAKMVKKKSPYLKFFEEWEMGMALVEAVPGSAGSNDFGDPEEDDIPSGNETTRSGGGRKKKAFAFGSAALARKFREDLKIRFLKDELKARQMLPEIAAGYISRKSVWDAADLGLMVLPTPARGESGLFPHVVNVQGQEITPHAISNELPRDVIEKFKKGEYRFRSHQLRTNPVPEVVAVMLAEAGQYNKMPKEWQVFHDALKDYSLFGPPDETPDQHRWHTLPGLRQGLERLIVNAAAGSDAAERETQDPRFGEMVRLASTDAGRVSLQNSMEWLQEKEAARNPNHRVLRYINGHDPETGLKRDDLRHIVKRDFSKAAEDDPNLRLIDLTAEHLRYPFHNRRAPYLPGKLLVVPRTEGDRMLVRDLKSAAKPKIFRETETGRQWHPGALGYHGSFKELSRKSRRSLPDFRANAKDAYERAGLVFPEDDDALIVSIEDRHFMAHSRKLERVAQTVRLPSVQFDATVAPQMSAFDSPINTIVVPLDYVSQDLERGKLLRIYETGAEPFGNVHGDNGRDTGHTYESVLLDVRGLDEHGRKVGVPLSRLLDQVSSGEIGSALVEGTGLPSQNRLRQELEKWARKRWGDDYLNLPVLLIHFSTVNKHTWAYVDAPSPPIGIFSEGDLAPGIATYSTTAGLLAPK